VGVVKRYLAAAVAGWSAASPSASLLG